MAKMGFVSPLAVHYLESPNKPTISNVNGTKKKPLKKPFCFVRSWQYGVNFPFWAVVSCFTCSRNACPRHWFPAGMPFFKLLGDNGLLIRKKRTYRPVTTQSWHHFHKFGNLWQGRIPEAPNQVWAADITYIRICNGRFLYLSLLTDVYSHKIVGWALSDSLDMEAPLRALEMALKDLPGEHKLIHHSDRGVQYCSNAYVERLQSRSIQISMTENGDPRENAVAERVNGILKEEWINRESIESLEEGKEVIGRIIELYNKKRPHLSNNYLTPEQAHTQKGVLKRQWKTYYKKKEDVYKVKEVGVTL